MQKGFNRGVLRGKNQHKTIDNNNKKKTDSLQQSQISSLILFNSVQFRETSLDTI